MDELILLVGGVFLSLCFEYIPGVRDWFGGLAENNKRFVMAIVLLLVPAVAFLLSCAGWMQDLYPELSATCDKSGAVVYIRGYILALVANQGTHRLLPK